MRRHLEIRKTDAVLTFFNQFSPNLVRLLRLWLTTHICYPKRLVARIQHGGCRHLKFRKTDAVLPNFTKFHQIWYECWDFEWQHMYAIKKRPMARIQHGGCHILNLENGCRSSTFWPNVTKFVNRPFSVKSPHLYKFLLSVIFDTCIFLRKNHMKSQTTF